MKRGFTLIEVLVVIVIIAILAAIISPGIIRLLNKNRQEMYNNQIRTLEEAAKRWSVNNFDKLNEDLTSEHPYCLSLDDLALGGYISGSDLINPINNEDLEGAISITYDRIYSQYDFRFSTTCEGNH